MDKLKNGKLKVIFLGGKQAGVIGLLTSLVWGCDVKAVVTVSKVIVELSKELGIPSYRSIKQQEVVGLLGDVDLIISVHSREIVPIELLNKIKLGGINVHPCLWKYKGKEPIQRFLLGDDKVASVGVHRMTEQVDMGETLFELFVDIDRVKIKEVIEVYNELYPVYSIVLLRTLDLLRGLKNEK